MATKIEKRLKIKRRIRGKIEGTMECPRLTVYRSNKQIYAQIVDDISGKTLASASSLKIEDKLPKKEIAAKVGELIAQNAKEAGIETISFDRNGYLYHGRVRELANGARKAGLKF
jgi:large subunit ribosomal protein L18